MPDWIRHMDFWQVVLLILVIGVVIEEIVKAARKK